jgi:hypothetical protein
MPRPDKATFIQNMLSELEHQQNGSAPSTPEPDSKEWWREVAQELGVKAQQAEADNRRLREALEWCAQAVLDISNAPTDGRYVPRRTELRDAAVGIFTRANAALAATPTEDR